MVGIAVLAIALFWRFALVTSESWNHDTSGAGSLVAIPLPDDSYVGTVVDPGDYPSAPSADAAQQAARANQPNLVGVAPFMRLMRIARTTAVPEAQMDGLFWVILSPDARVPLTGPAGYRAPEEYTSYGWVFVDMSGAVVEAAALSYPAGAARPPLPAN
jgi:hypothetical protein